ncbi:PREDICTED: tolloid-like protein 2 isoform X1 [Amphimedon queenslandica]|uniref:Metalloendopeptidase n=1 Tax=Amphimedon queenslandica TaxID=400682 RepID=A0AAN0IJ08_AMPQE|nr:PREDICTED: tolloid-like protein 2 isoform X1 [Amphimedon queenslandica]|eukprot:XP_003390431.2 PREDICTED: tolloid-like protein 2 isoform X1 [Amphimedon queenslandica]
MIRLALLVLLLATANCSPTSKRSWSGPGPDKNDDHPPAVKPEDKEESNLELGKPEDKEESNLELGKPEDNEESNLDLGEDEEKKDDLDDDKKDDLDDDKKDELDFDDNHDKNTDNQEADHEDKDEDDKNSNKDEDYKNSGNKNEDDEKDNFKTELVAELTEEVTQVPANLSGEYSSGKDIVEGDIKMTPEQAALFKRDGWDGLVNSEAWLRGHGKWSRTIPYTISGVATSERNALTNSIRMFHQHTCLRFTPKRSYNYDYIQFVSSGGCWSYIGKLRNARPQRISLSSGCSRAVPAHEIMHALGRYHEQSRADRDRYVRIITRNIRSGYARNFNRHTNSDSQSLPYDYLSLMHYGRYAFSKNRRCTIVPIPDASVTIGQRDRMSMYDIHHVNIRYCPERALRLVGGRGSYEGRVEVYWDERWGTVCDDYFGHNDGRVICKYLGFPDVAATYHRARFGQGSGPIVMDDLRCAGNEYSPFACPMRTIGTHNCGHYEDASVTCQKNVRLVGGRITSRCAVGRLEVYAEGRWGTVCDDYFDINDAHVVCRQLGYRRASCVYPRARYGQGTLPILMDDVQCTGREAQITHCRSTPIGEHNCRHYEDVSVRCLNY